MFITDYMTQCRYLSLEQLSDTIKKLNNLLPDHQEPANYHKNPLLRRVFRIELPRFIEIIEKIRKVFKMKQTKSQQEAYQNSASGIDGADGNAS